jgi:hypothetical protein
MNNGIDIKLKRSFIAVKNDINELKALLKEQADVHTQLYENQKELLKRIRELEKV